VFLYLWIAFPGSKPIQQTYKESETTRPDSGQEYMKIINWSAQLMRKAFKIGKKSSTDFIIAAGFSFAICDKEN